MTLPDLSCTCDHAGDVPRETSWFRDQQAFRALATSVLPSLLDARSATRHLVVWSASCASGQEPYSLAILLDEHLPEGWTAEVLATGACARMVERVRTGHYSQVEVNHGLQANSLVQYFSRVGTEGEVVPHLRAMVRAEQLDLTRDLPVLPAFDLVLLRDTLGHLPPAVRAEVVERVRGVVARDGYPLLGPTEHDLDLGDRWLREPCGRTSVHRPTTATDALTAGA